jgi:hypothetical protein
LEAASDQETSLRRSLPAIRDSLQRNETGRRIDASLSAFHTALQRKGPDSLHPAELDRERSAPEDDLIARIDGEPDEAELEPSDDSAAPETAGTVDRFLKTFEAMRKNVLNRNRKWLRHLEDRVRAGTYRVSSDGEGTTHYTFERPLHIEQSLDGQAVHLTFFEHPGQATQGPHTLQAPYECRCVHWHCITEDPSAPIPHCPWIFGEQSDSSAVPCRSSLPHTLSEPCEQGCAHVHCQVCGNALPLGHPGIWIANTIDGITGDRQEHGPVCRIHESEFKDEGDASPG